MAKAFINDENLTDIADAIRATLDESRQYLPSEMAGAIQSIPIMAQLNRKKYFRPVPAGAASGYATIEKIEGNTVKFNQLMNVTFESTVSNMVTITNNGDGTITINGTATGGNGTTPGLISIPGGYKYLCIGNYIQIRKNGGTNVISSCGSGYFLDAEADAYYVPRVRVAEGITVSNFTIYPLVYNLTAIFGAGNEPTTVADFEAWMAQNIGTLPYYDYNAGELLSVKMQSVKSVGFNQWDEEWERCYWNEGAGGVKILNNNSFGCKDYINVLPNTDYYFEVPGLPNFYILQYDSNKTLITYSNYSGKRAFHTESNCHYITFYSYFSYGTTYNNDICINLSDPSKNGTYKPYLSDTKTIDVTTITGINTSTNVREVIFPNGMKQADYAGTVKDTLDLLRDKATVKVGSRAYQAGDESDTDVITDGTTTYYALSTPIEYTDLQDANGNPLNPRYKVEHGGTEQVLPVNTSTPTTVAPTLTTTYTKNVH